ncbi:hypothetical protein BB341_27430 [Streptomyces clavuligerus]|nr:hypothetical protein BB341_27430 [Streptomyces clavuligerus]AXU16307.1 hypothetical protein D1794_28500 [Streptomyces clavuligerus]QCS09087.1 hypothetical protein CRV15_27860 [Streptomyces clavuligerus]
MTWEEKATFSLILVMNKPFSGPVRSRAVRYGPRPAPQLPGTGPGWIVRAGVRGVASELTGRMVTMGCP